MCSQVFNRTDKSLRNASTDGIIVTYVLLEACQSYNDKTNQRLTQQTLSHSCKRMANISIFHRMSLRTAGRTDWESRSVECPYGWPAPPLWLVSISSYAWNS